MSTESNTPVDPRVQVELEKLNSATDNINKFEVELDEVKCEFKRIYAESVIRIKQSAHKLGNSIEAAKPYYESRIYAAQLTKETQQATINYEKAKSIHSAAKEMVYLAEQGLGEKSTLDTACQEMLSHAASKVNQSQLDVTDARNSLKMCQLKLEVANNRVGKLQGQLKQAIKASRPYYETKANYNGILKGQKEKINELERKVSEAKITYNEALKNLEQISEEIHRQRQEKNNTINYDELLKQTNDDENMHIKRTTKCTEKVLDFENRARNQRQFPNDVISSAECLVIPIKLNTSSKSTDQCQPDGQYSQNMFNDFETILTFPQSLAAGMHKSASSSASDIGHSDCITDNIFSLHGPYEIKSSSNLKIECGGTGEHKNAKYRDINSSVCDRGGTIVSEPDDNVIEQWTEIRLSHSDSTSSSYSNQSVVQDQQVSNNGYPDDNQSQHSSSSSDEPRRKVTCTTIFNEDQMNPKRQGLSQWLARSNSFKIAGRRQSLDLLIDASDKVKDVFNIGIQRVGRTLERRSSESEMNNDGIQRCGGNTNTTPITTSSSTTSSATEFFLFSRSSEPKEILSDEQVENLLLSHSIDQNGTIIVEELKSPLQDSIHRTETATSTFIATTSKPKTNLMSPSSFFL